MVFTILSFDGLCWIFKRCYIKKKDIGDKFMPEKKLCRSKYHYHSDSKGEHDETYFYFESVNDCIAFLLSLYFTFL